MPFLLKLVTHSEAENLDCKTLHSNSDVQLPNLFQLMWLKVPWKFLLRAGLEGVADA